MCRENGKGLFVSHLGRRRVLETFDSDKTNEHCTYFFLFHFILLFSECRKCVSDDERQFFLIDVRAHVWDQTEILRTGSRQVKLHTNRLFFVLFTTGSFCRMGRNCLSVYSLSLSSIVVLKKHTSHSIFTHALLSLLFVFKIKYRIVSIWGLAFC